MLLNLQGKLLCLHEACTGRLQLGRRFDGSMLAALKGYPAVRSFDRGHAGLCSFMASSTYPLCLLLRQGLLHGMPAA